MQATIRHILQALIACQVTESEENHLVVAVPVLLSLVTRHIIVIVTIITTTIANHTNTKRRSENGDLVKVVKTVTMIVTQILLHESCRLATYVVMLFWA